MAGNNPNFISGTVRAVSILDIVEAQTPLVKRIAQDIKNELTAGDSPTINIRVPGRGRIVEGAVQQADFLQRVNALVPVSLTKKTSPDTISEIDASTSLESWQNEVAQPIAEIVATDINKRTYKAIIDGIDSAIVKDSAGSSSFNDLSMAIASVRNSRMAGKMTGALNNSLMGAVRTSGVNLFSGGSIASDLYSGFDIANYGGVEFISTADAADVVYPSTFPTAISGTVANGANKIPLASAINYNIPDGVLFTIAGVNRVDAEGNVLVGELKVFATAYTPSGSSFINLRTPLIFTPALSDDNNSLAQVKNVSALPASNAAITLKGTLGKTYMTGVVFSEKIAVHVNRPLTSAGKYGEVTTTSIAGINSIQLWKRSEPYNGDILYSVSRLDKQHPFLGIGGTAYYVAKS